ncbi:Uncharacterised protein [Mycobacteroides abscessus subsp. abscessus]|nr:Uncharacterised protein [Mycobacteroides abscessus subsp. abscessus]SIH25530.1 Uncharacterised protein [Mycobacteroides abscessus subsp. abscessus]SKU57132.1 Uncharacterised protein [Mycobacteroides abscessus subsp. abscessus]
MLGMWPVMLTVRRRTKMSRHPHTAAARKVCRLALHGTPGSDPVHREPFVGAGGYSCCRPTQRPGPLRSSAAGPASTTPPRHTPFTSPITPESDTTIGTSVRVAARQEFSGRDSGRKTRNTFVYKDFDALHMYNFCMTKGLIRLPDTPSRYVML